MPRVTDAPTLENISSNRPVGSADKIFKGGFSIWMDLYECIFYMLAVFGDEAML